MSYSDADRKISSKLAKLTAISNFSMQSFENSLIKSLEVMVIVFMKLKIFDATIKHLFRKFYDDFS